MPRASLLAALACLALGACDEPVPVSLEAAPVDEDQARADKVDVCHQGSTGPEILSVAARAADAHLDNHGDWLVTAEVCADDVDNDCDGEEDEDCCPCFGLADLQARYDGGAFACYEVAVEGVMAYTQLFAEWEMDGLLDRASWFSVDYVLGEYLYCGHYDRSQDLETGEVHVDSEAVVITADEHLGCVDLLEDYAADRGVECTGS